MAELIILAAVVLQLATPICSNTVSEQVDIAVIGNVEQGDVELVKEILDALPENHLLDWSCIPAVKRVIIVDGHTLRDLPADADVFKHYPSCDASAVAGLADLLTGDVYIATGDLRNVAYHEIGHIVFDGPAGLDFYNLLTGYKLQQMYTAGDVSMGDYSRKNVREFRAEAYEHCAVGKQMSSEVEAVMQGFLECR